MHEGFCAYPHAEAIVNYYYYSESLLLKERTGTTLRIFRCVSVLDISREVVSRLIFSGGTLCLFFKQGLSMQVSAWEIFD